MVFKHFFSKYANGMRDPPPLHSKIHFKFPFWLLEPFPKWGKHLKKPFIAASSFSSLSSFVWSQNNLWFLWIWNLSIKDKDNTGIEFTNWSWCYSIWEFQFKVWAPFKCHLDHMAELVQLNSFLTNYFQYLIIFSSFHFSCKTMFSIFNGMRGSGRFWTEDYNNALRRSLWTQKVIM